MIDIKYYNDNFLPGVPLYMLDQVKQLSQNEEQQLNLNSLNYRCAEFEKIDWKNSIVIFGCSNVFGTGLLNTDTICAQLEKIVGRPVINMGVPASSISYSVFNQLVLGEKKYNPYAVVNIWTSINRLTYFSTNFPYHAGPWTSRLNKDTVNMRSVISLFQAWNLNECNPALHSLMLQRFAKLIWNNTQHIEGTFFPSTSETLDVELFHNNDYAFDDHHPGPNTARIVASRLAEQLF